MTKFEPNILAFCCNWCSYAGADLAGVSRLQMPPNVKVIRVMCSARIEPEIVLKAFDSGIDGVLVLGCHIGDCHYISGNYRTLKRFELFAKLLDIVGVDSRRFKLDWVSASEAQRFQTIIITFVEQVRALGRINLGLDEKLILDYGKKPEKTQFFAVYEQETRARVKQLLDSKKVDGVVGLLKLGGVVVPHLFTDCAEVENLVTAPKYPLPKLIRQLLGSDLKLGAVLRGCELRAIVELAKHNQIEMERLIPVGVACTPEQAKSCRCLYPYPETEIVVGHRTEPLREELPVSRDWKFWKAQFSKCNKCYACITVCPACVCNGCLLEKKEWVGTGTVPPSITFPLLKAYHMADKCVLCGECESACAAGIPLTALYSMLLNEMHKKLGYVPGKELDKISPLLTDKLA